VGIQRPLGQTTATIDLSGLDRRFLTAFRLMPHRPLGGCLFPQFIIIIFGSDKRKARAAIQTAESNIF